MSASEPSQNVKRFVDRKLLSAAVNLPSESSKNATFVCGKQIQDFMLPMVQVEELGCIQIPVSLQDVDKLKRISSKAPYGKGKNIFYNPTIIKAWHIDPLKILSPPDWSSLIIPHLGLPTVSMNVEAKLSQLILYETGGYYHRDFTSHDFGTIGMAILQLPVEDGHDGGYIKAEYKGNKKIFETHANSHQRFYLSAFFGDCTHVMDEPVKRGWKIALVFRLVWTNARTNAPNDVPIFLSALKNIEEALSPWIPHERIDSMVVKDTDAMKVDDIGFTSSSAPQIAVLPKSKIASEESSGNDQEDSDCSDDYDCISLEEDTLDEDALFFVLKEKYKVDDLTFNRLRGKDQHLAQLLQNCNFLDVHLAMVILENTNKKRNGCREEDISANIVRWIDSNNVMRKLSLKLDWQKQRVGPIRKLLTSSGLNHDREKIIYDEEDVKEDETDEDYDGEDESDGSHDGDDGSDESHDGEDDQEEDDEEYQDDEDEEYQADEEDGEVENGENLVEEENSEEVYQRRKNRLIEGRNLLRRLIMNERAKEEDSNVITRTRYFYHFILVIWPKHQKFRMYCRYGLHSLLGDMERFLSSATPVREENNRREITEDLQKIISFCSTEPHIAWSEWNEQGKRKGELAPRLLRLCIALQAREEGLALLKILGSNFVCGAGISKAESFEGIQNEQVAQTIADFECQVSGWDDCADLIKRMISFERIIKQLVPLSKLAQYFFDANCFQGAKMIGDWITFSFINVDHIQAEKFTTADVNFYVNFLVSLEGEAKTSNRERLVGFVSLFPKLAAIVQCRLILDLESQGTLRFKGIDSCQFMFPDLCKAFLSCNLHTQSLKDIVTDVLLCFVRLGNAEWLNSLMSNICRVPPFALQTISSFKSELPETLVSSSAFWELAASSELRQSPACLEWYRKTCRWLITQDFTVPLVKSLEEVAEKMIRCLFFLNDEQSWESFASQICKSFVSDTSNFFVLQFVKNVDFQQILRNSIPASAAFVVIVDYWVQQWESLKEPMFTWQQNKAVLSSYPEVEAFLRSPQERITFAKFSRIAEAQRFAQMLEREGPMKGFSVSATPKGKGKNSRCEIVKNRSYFDHILNNFKSRKSELDDLIRLRSSLSHSTTCGNTAK